MPAPWELKRLKRQLCGDKDPLGRPTSDVPSPISSVKASARAESPEVQHYATLVFRAGAY